MHGKTRAGLRQANAPGRRPVPPHGIALCALTAALILPGPARATGGHHAVDDAAMLDAGQCQIETWVDRETGGARTLLHAGPACRVGAVELGLNLDRVQLDGARTTSVAGAQIKWARTLSGGWSAGLVFGVAGQDGAPRYLGSTVVVPVTWQVTESLLAHVNVGRDFRRGQADTNRAGLALEWAPLSAWSFVAERFREGSVNFWRAGSRWAFTPTLNIDLSRARSLDSSAAAWWTLGLAWVFER